MRQAGNVPEAVKSLVNDVYGSFFEPTSVTKLSGGFPPAVVVTGSPMGVATPIWHDLRFKVCNDGTVARIRPATPILQSSFMPDQYLYFDGWAVDLNGARTYSSLPIISGDFPKFTNMSDPTFTVPNQFFTCAKDKGQNGNPWDMDPPLPWSISPDFNPDTVHPCSNDDYTPGTQYTP